MSDKTADYNRQRIIHLAKKHAESLDCPRCHAQKKDWKIIPLFEYGDLEMPSQVILYCNSCKKFNQVFAQASDEQARAHAKSIMEGDKGLADKGFRKATPEEASKIIKLK